MKLIRISSALLALLISAAAAAACGDSSSQPSGGNAPSDVGGGAAVEETTTEDPNGLRLPDDLDFDGSTIMFLTEHSSGYDWYTSKEIYAEQENGELFNDAVYRRNLLVEDRLNVKIAQTNVDTAVNVAQKSLSAGDTEYDVVMPYINSNIKLIQQGLCYNLYDIPYLDLEKPWWDQRANDNMTIGGKLYMTTGDISILDNECTMVMFFSKKMVADYALTTPYDYVTGGTWTHETLNSMLHTVILDVDGDGKFNKNDQFGLSIAGNAPISFYFAAGERIIDTDESGELQLMMNSRRAPEVIDRIISTCINPDAYNNVNKFSGGFDEACKMFLDGRLMITTFALVDINGLRDAEFEFGILPYPKFDEIQEDYDSLISSGLSPATSVPYNVKNKEMSGAVLEALAYQSVDTLTVAYYDNALKTRYVRDEESGAMLDIIFATRVYDLGFMMDVGGLSSLVGSLYSKKSTDFASAYAKAEPKAIAALDELKESLAG
ncbi:MAG: hypothetical protein K6D94_03715 [Clostridiales bacterium]|nr:hypothetical protein [Clostridiales bacterium]